MNNWTAKSARVSALAIALAIGSATMVSPAHAIDEPCDPAVEEAIKQAAEEGYKRALEGIQEDVVQPAAVKVASCLDDILNSGFSLDMIFRPPNLSGILNGIANRICDKANEMFQEAASKITDALPTDAFEQFGISINPRIRRNASQRIQVNPRIYSPLDGSRMDVGNISTGETNSSIRDTLDGMFGGN